MDENFDMKEEDIASNFCSTDLWTKSNFAGIIWLKPISLGVYRGGEEEERDDSLLLSSEGKDFLNIT